MTQSIVIIGSGLAGYMLAKELRKVDQTTPLTIVTASDGSFYSKPQLSTALTNKRTPDALAMKTAQEMQQELNATIHANYVVSRIDKNSQTICSDDPQQPDVTYSKLIFACGAQKIQPMFSGDAIADIHSVNDLQDYREFHAWIQNKKRIAILGTGLVGCEFANDLSNAGYEVHLIAPESYPLAKFVPQRIGEALITALRDNGVHWHLGHFATQVNRDEQGYSVSLSNGESVFADGVMSAIGLRPLLSLAELVGLKTNTGIVVDRYLRTSEPNMYALGDCAEVNGQVKQYVAPILQCARALAKILTGSSDPVSYPSMPIIVKTPACPVVAEPAPQGVEGEWQYDGEGTNLRALFHDRDGQLRGFVLTGNTIREKMALAKQLPMVFAE